MKKTFSVLASLVVLLASCSVKDLGSDCVQCRDNESGKLYSVGVGICSGDITCTRVDEGQVAGVQFFVFNAADGKFINKYTSGQEGYVQLFLGKGTYHFYAVVNHGSITASSALDTAALLNTQVTLVNDEATFGMFGSRRNVSIDGNGHVDISVSRIVAKVNVNVRTAFTNVETGKVFKLKKVYMTNIQGANSFALNSYQSGSGVWYNKMQLVPSGTFVNSLLCSPDYDRTMSTAGDNYSPACTLFAFPNENRDKSVNGEVWSARCTRLVIEAEYDGKICYYPVSFTDGVKPNSQYTVNATLTRPGYSDPEGRSGLADCLTSAVTVKPWTIISPINETF